MVRVKRKIKDRPILGPSFIKKLLREDYDYGTGNVNGTDIFDITKTGMTFYNQLLPSADDETKKYMENRKGIVGHIEYMTPQEYYDDAARIHKTTAYNLKQQREYDRDIIDKLKDVITNKKKKFPITFLSFSKNYKGQEGLHRMYAAAELFGWDDVKFPVLVIEDASWTVSEKISNINVKEKNFKRSEKSLELNEVYPNKGESKKDFISRFMSVTKDEYPDRKQRYAVALSYWNRRNENLTEEKIAYLPKEHIDAINNKYKDYYKNYSIEKVAISDLLKDDPGLNDYNDLGSYHEIIWGDDVSKYRYDPKKNTNPSDVPSVVYKNGKYYINDGRHRIKALANSGYDYVELPVLREAVLTEAKEDIEEFIDKFGQDIYNWFVKSKDRLKNNKISTDILYHVKNTSAEDMQNILHNLQSKVKSDDLTKIQGEYNYLGERDGYKVYQPLDALASMNLGVGSGWCTTGRYGHYGDVNFKPSIEDAKKHWGSYTKHGIQFYYLLDSKTMLAKYAIALYPRLLGNVDRILPDYFIEQTNFEIYNAEDKLDYNAYFKLENVLKLIPESLIFKAIKSEDIGETVEALVQNNTVINSKIYRYSSVNTVIIPEGVTSIGNSAFYNCGNLTHITIPDSVTSIGTLAFAYCSNLTDIELPDNITSIDYGAFEHCRKLESIKLPTSLIDIGHSAFFSCRSLTNIEIPNTVTSIGQKSFWGCINLTKILIPDSVTSIEAGAFEMCINLAHVDMSNNVKSISKFIFNSCGSLTNITIPEGVTRIEEGAFFNCDNLKNIKLPNSLTSIGSGAFSGCTSLTSIEIPESVTTIYPYAFRGCQNLTIYREATKKPDGWKRNWNPDKRPVIRGYKGEAKQEKLSPKKRKSRNVLVYNAGDVNAGIAMFNHAAAAESLNEDENDYTNLSSSQLENLLFNDLFSEKNLTDTFKSINILPAVTDNVPKGPSFITRDGKFIDVMRTSDFIDRSKFTNRFNYSALTHYDWLKLTCEALFGSKLKAYRDMLEIVTDKLGWVRCNTGESPEEDRFYCVVPDRSESRMTPKQYDSLEKYLIYGKNKNKEVLVFGGDAGNTSNSYSLRDPYYIIEKIKDYYRTGILIENVQFSNNALSRMDKYVNIIKNKNNLALLDGRDTPICYASAINNLFYFHRLGKDCILHLGTFDETGNTIVHAWVECEGKVYQTAEPKNKPKNYKLKSLKQIEISKDMSEDDIEKAIKGLDLLLKENASDYVPSDEFKLYTAGYILENGSYITLDEYHAEEPEFRNKKLIEFSSTHYCDDVAVRIYKQPTEAQYNSLEKVIDSFLDEYFYCKLECEGNGPILYKAYCLYENAVDDDGYTEQVIGNWTGWDLIKIIKKYYQNNEDLSLKESKEDIEKFVNKFGQETYNWFVKSKDRLKNNKISTDILYHVKNTSVEDMQNILHNLQSKVKSKDFTKIQGEYNYLGEFGGYKVYQPLDALASMNLGVGSGWCTTGRYGHYRDVNFKPSLKDAEKHWNEYASRGIEFYYLLDAKTMLAEYAIAVYPKTLNVDEVTPDYYIEQTNFEIYNAWDDLDYEAYFSLKDTLEQIPNLNLLFKGEKLEETETIEAIVEENRVIRSPKYIKAKNIIIPDGAISIDDSAFSYSHLTSIKIPNSVKSIGVSAFFNCSNLTSIELPDSLTVIGSSAFSNCSSLTNIEIPDSVVRIDSLAFYACSNLTSIIIPDTVAHIRYYAFDRCINLKIYCEAKSQPEGWDKAWNRDNRPVVWGYKGKKRESLEEDVEIHNTLNSKFWKDNELKAEIREKIEAIVERFKTYLNDKNIKIDVKDILLLGSNASYNYTDDSDLDIHIIVEPKEITEDEELLKQLYDLAASAFNDKFNITLKNSDAEVYVELNNTDAHSNGIYSLEKGWIKEPVKDELKNVELDKAELNKWKKRYLSVLKEKDAKKIKKFIAELYKLRKDSIAADGEYSQGNLIFKEMRNLGYISKLKDLLDEIESKELSLEKLNEAKEDIQKFVDKFGQDIYDWFIKSKDRLKNNKISTDILYHVKNTSIEDMQNILHNLQAKTATGDLTKIQGEYKYLGEVDNYKVYQPLDALASMNLGTGSGWCTTGRYDHYGDVNFKPSLTAAKAHWNEYTSQGIKFYYLLDSKTMLAEYAIVVYPKILDVNKAVSDYYIEQTNFEIYNAEDKIDYSAYISLRTVIEQIPNLNLLFKGEKLEETESVEAVVEENKVIRSPKYLKAKNIIIPDNATSIDDYAFG